MERKRHKDILSIIEKIDTNFLNKSGCYFAGGTSIAMAFGEKRTSFDMDFLASFESFHMIKERIQNKGMESILKSISCLGDPVISRNMIKSVVRENNGEPIKLEIILENDMDLMPTRGLIKESPEILTVSTKVMVAQKLMACSDRGLDKSVHHRDYWDLCVLANNIEKSDFVEGTKIAKSIYGDRAIESGLISSQKDARKTKSSDFEFLSITDANSMKLGEKKINSYLGLGLNL